MVSGTLIMDSCRTFSSKTVFSGDEIRNIDKLVVQQILTKITIFTVNNYGQYYYYFIFSKNRVIISQMMSITV